MKAKTIALAVTGGALGLLLGGCATPPEPQPLPPPQPLKAEYQERCYSMDDVPQEVSGRAYLQAGSQFYYHNDCGRHLALDLPTGTAVASLKQAPTVEAATPTKRTLVEGSDEADEPTCFDDKELSGRGDLEPCPADSLP